MTALGSCASSAEIELAGLLLQTGGTPDVCCRAGWRSRILEPLTSESNWTSSWRRNIAICRELVITHIIGHEIVVPEGAPGSVRWRD